jgi:hypothetical protein
VRLTLLLHTFQQLCLTWLLTVQLGRHTRYLIGLEALRLLQLEQATQLAAAAAAVRLLQALRC